MNNIRLILKVYFMGQFGINKAFHSKDAQQRQKALLIAILSVVGVLALAAYWTLYCIIIDENLRAAGAKTAILAVVFAAVNVICLATTVYKGTSILFSSEDFNIVMPLPIKMSEMVTAKLLTLYLSNLFFTVGLMVPAMGVYAWHQNPSLLFYVYGLIALLVTPMLPIMIGVLVSVVISVISARFKHHNMIAIILMLLVFGGIMVFSFGLTGIDQQHMDVLTQNLVQNISSMINKMYPITPLFVGALSAYNVMALLGLVGISLGSFGVFVAIIGPRFGRIHTMLNTSHTTKDYRMTQLQTKSPLIAMYQRELRRFIASPMYVMNSAFGMIMLLIMAGGLVFKIDTVNDLIAKVPQFASALPLFICIGIVLCIITTDTTAISLSMEGKYFSILKGYPISVMDIFHAKMMVNLTVTVPLTVVVLPIIGIVCQMSILEIGASYVLVGMYALLGPMYGLIVNLIFPKLEWDHENVVIKQSMASMLGVLGGIPFVLVSGLGLVLIGVMEVSIIILLLSLIIGMLNLLLYWVLKTWGVRKFYEL